MNFSGSYRFKENIEKIWKYLNNPKILKECIDGCEEFKEKEKNIFFLRIKVKIGPINAIFSGTLSLTNINPPNSYIIEAKGSAGQLGGANGKVEISLAEKDNMTYLNYKANTRINGKIAQLGSRLIDGTVKKNTNAFFKNFDSLFDESDIVSSKTIVENNNTELTSTKKLNKNYIYIIFIVFFLIFFVVVNNE